MWQKKEEALQKYMELRFDHESVRLTNTDNVCLSIQFYYKIADHCVKIENLVPVLNHKPMIWRLTIPSSGDLQNQELVLSIQGVIAAKDLPPITNRYVIYIVYHLSRLI